MTQRLNAIAARKYTDRNGDEKTSYTRIGVAFPFKDKDGFTVRLEAMPAPQDGEFTILLLPPKDDNNNPGFGGSENPVPF